MLQSVDKPTNEQQRHRWMTHRQLLHQQEIAWIVPPEFNDNCCGLALGCLRDSFLYRRNTKDIKRVASFFTRTLR